MRAGGGDADKKWNIPIIGYLKGVGRMATHVQNTPMNEIRKVFGEGNKIESYDSRNDAELKSGWVVFIEFAKPEETCHS